MPVYSSPLGSSYIEVVVAAGLAPDWSKIRYRASEGRRRECDRFSDHLALAFFFGLLWEKLRTVR